MRREAIKNFIIATRNKPRLVESLRKARQQNQQPLELIILSNQRVAYLNNPKSGCTTIKNLLSSMELGCYPTDPMWVHYNSFDGLINSHYQNTQSSDYLKGERVFLFTFVRHPLQRFKSALFDKILLKHDLNFERTRQAFYSYIGYQVDHLHPAMINDLALSFLDFLASRSTTTQGIEVGDTHFNDQFCNLYSAAPDLQYHFIGRVEDMQHELAELAAKQRWPVLAEEDFSRKDNRTMSEIYRQHELSDAVIERVKELYRRDFTALNYSI